MITFRGPSTTVSSGTESLMGLEKENSNLNFGNGNNVYEMLKCQLNRVAVYKTLCTLQQRENSVTSLHFAVDLLT